MKSAIGPMRANAFRIAEWTQVYIQAKFPPAKATAFIDPSGTEWIMDLRGCGEVIAPVGIARLTRRLDALRADAMPVAR